MDRYKYKISMKYTNTKTKKVTVISDEKITSIVIDYDYDNLNMPIIYATMSLNKKLVDTIITTKKVGIITLKISKFIYNQDNDEDSVKSNIVYFNNQFAYFTTDNVNYNDTQDYSYDNKDSTQFRTITLGLISKKHIEANNRSINGIIKDSNMLSAISMCSSKLPNLLLEPLNYNKKITKLIIPQLSTVASELAYFNSVSVFYKTSYRYFLDFNGSYIISSNGKGVKRKGELIDTVIVTIKKPSDEYAGLQGMKIDKKKKTCEFYVPASDATVAQDDLTSSLYSSIEGVSTTGDSTTSKVNSNAGVVKISTSTNYVVHNDNTNKLKNIKSDTESMKLTVLVSKNDLDSSLFTINRKYQVKNYDKYNDKNGLFLLYRKREVYTRENDFFAVNVMLNFKKVVS